MNPLTVIGIGLGGVFLTLTVLTLATYFFGIVINKFFVKEDENEEKRRVAAIVAAIHSRGER